MPGVVPHLHGRLVAHRPVRSTRHPPALERTVVLRTHEAGTLRATTPAPPSPSPAGWPAGAITAAWPSSTCGTPRASSRWWSGTRRWPTHAAQRVLPRGDRRGGRRPGRATRTPSCRPARSRSSPTTSRCSTRPRRCRSRSTSRRGRRGGAAASYRYLDLRRAGPGRGASGCARGQPGGPRRAGRARLRRDRDADADPLDARGCPRLPGARAAAARALVRAAAVAAAVQAAADGRPAWSGTSRSPAATATRTSAPTGSRSSPSSTSR